MKSWTKYFGTSRCCNESGHETGGISGAYEREKTVSALSCRYLLPPESADRCVRSFFLCRTSFPPAHKDQFSRLITSPPLDD